MSQYKIHSERLIEAITLLRTCQQQVRDAERSIYNRENPLSFQAMTDVSRILCNMKNVRQKLCRLDDDLATLQKALIYIGDKSEDVDRQVSNILRGRGYLNIIDDAKDTVNDFMKHFQGWFDSDTKDNSKENEKDNDVIYVEPVHTIVLNPDSSPDEIERVYTEDYNKQDVPDGLSYYSYSGDNCNYNGNNYDDFLVLDGFNEDACICQRNIDHKDNEKMCTSTAQSIAYLIKNGIYTDPCSTWDGGTVWTDSYLLEETKTWTEVQKMKKIYELIMSGTPVILNMQRYVDGEEKWHTVTVIGLHKDADINNLSYDDILIVDPWDGKVKKLSEQNYSICNNSGWSLKIPK